VRRKSKQSDKSKAEEDSQELDDELLDAYDQKADKEPSEEKDENGSSKDKEKRKKSNSLNRTPHTPSSNNFLKPEDAVSVADSDASDEDVEFEIRRKKSIHSLAEQKDDILDSLSNKERREFREAFRLFDKDDDGTITWLELQEVFTALNYHFTDEQIKKMVSTIDVDGDGQIDLEEFILMMRGKDYGDPKNKKSYIDELRDAFEVMDKDGNGSISMSELAYVMKALGETLETDEIAVMVSEADTDGDGNIDFEEFEKLMKQDHLLQRYEGFNNKRIGK